MIIQAIARAWGSPSLPDWNCFDAAPMPISDQQTPKPPERDQTVKRVVLAGMNLKGHQSERKASRHNSPSSNLHWGTLNTIDSMRPATPIFPLLAGFWACPPELTGRQ
ncbi:hypothetical protein [Bradyrhizobium sp. sGM-13]|uniref:hypothetical protein n=1 Tax=Bradyrhizobium sp. sGM-13 TaxID=2831781 RepID=UPI001BCD4109|nr:hypothetical protein [Bradyrhizobium sp. sGM-13]